MIATKTQKNTWMGSSFSIPIKSDVVQKREIVTSYFYLCCIYRHSEVYFILYKQEYHGIKRTSQKRELPQ